MTHCYHVRPRPRPSASFAVYLCALLVFSTLGSTVGNKSATFEKYDVPQPNKGGELSYQNSEEQLHNSTEIKSGTMRPSENSSSTASGSSGNICKTKQCNMTASRMLSLVDMSEDPCENFYSYSCGGLFNNPTLLEDDPAVDVWNRIERAVKHITDESPNANKKLKNYYKGCIEYGKLDTLEERKKKGRKVLDDISTFTKPGEQPTIALEDLLVKLWQYGSSPLFNFKLDVDPTNSSKFQMVLSPPEWPHFSHFLSSEELTQRCRFKADEKLSPNLDEAHAVYTQCLINFTEYINMTHEALIFFGVFDDLPTNEATDLMQGILISTEADMLETLQEFFLTSLLKKDIEFKTYTLTPLFQLDSDIPPVSWSSFLPALMNKSVEITTNVQVYSKSTLYSLFEKLSMVNERQVHNALLAMFAHDLYRDIVSLHHTCDRERYCLRVASTLMPDVVSKLYMSTFDNHKELYSQVLKTHDKLVKTMEDKLQHASWLDGNTRREVEDKLTFMSVQLPPLLNDFYVDASVERCPLNKKDYIEDSVCLLKQFQVQMSSRYTQDPHTPEVMWPHFLSSFSTHTVFIYSLNTFMIPYSLLGPLYDQEMPQHVVMAKLGNLLARGIGHNFDPTGVKFAASGKLGEMLFEASAPSYRMAEEISMSQFWMMRSHVENGHIYIYHIDPDISLNERLSDITAVNLSLSVVDDITSAHGNDTRLPWVPFSPKQVYFLTIAQTFCSKKTIAEEVPSLFEGTSLPASIRVWNIISNSMAGAAFGCPEGSNSNPIQMAKVLPFPSFEKENEEEWILFSKK